MTLPPVPKPRPVVGNLLEFRMVQRWQPGWQVNIAAEMQRLTLEIVAKALFNVDISQESTTLGKAFNDVREFPGRRRFSFRSWRINLPFTVYAGTCGQRPCWIRQYTILSHSDARRARMRVM